jgi:hypothetical protein
LKGYKWPGSDQIHAELVETERETLRTEVHKLINSIWSKEELFEQWKEYIVVSI